MTTEATVTQQRPEADAANGFRTQEVLVLSICHLIHDIYSGFLAPLLPLLIGKLSLSLTQAGFLTTIMQLPSLLNPYLGTLADHIIARYLFIGAPALTAVSLSLIGLAPSYGVLLILLLVAGLSAAIFHVPAPVMVARLSGTRKGRGMSFFMAGGELARTLGPLAAVGAVSLLGLEGLYPVMLVGIMASLWLFLRFRDVPIQSQSGKPASVRDTWREIRHIMIPLTAILVFRGFMHASVTAFLPTFIKLETGNLWLAGIALTVFEGAGVAGVLTAGSFSDRFGRRRTLMFSLLGAPASLFLFTAIGGWGRFMALIPLGLTLLSTTPVMLALIQENATRSPAAANGFFMMISFMARSAVVVVVGFIGDLIGLQITYFISALLGMAAIPFVMKLPKR